MESSPVGPVTATSGALDVVERERTRRHAADGGLVLPGDVESVGRYLTAAKADSTRKAYEADFRAWSDWARQRGVTPLPAADAAVAAYLAALSDAGASPRTVARRLSGIGHAHREAG